MKKVNELDIKNTPKQDALEKKIEAAKRALDSLTTMKSVTQKNTSAPKK